MAKGQPKKPTEPRVGDVVKFVGSSCGHRFGLGTYGMIIDPNIYNSEDSPCGDIRPWHSRCRQFGSRSDYTQCMEVSALKIIRGGAATNIRRKYDKDFKDATAE